ncbi:MAG: CdaR family protein [Desulfovibrionaceae bacterium]
MLKRLHFPSLFLAILISIVLWYMVIGREFVDTIMEVRLDYKGIPHNTVVRSGLENKVLVRVRGPKGLISLLNNKKESYTVDLANIADGENIVPLKITPPHSAFAIMETTPSKLHLIVDTLKEKVVPINVTINKKLFPDAEITSLSLSQNTVTIKGPQKLLENISEINTSITLPKEQQSGLLLLDITPQAPPSVDITPKQVKATVTIKIKTKKITLTKNIIVRDVEKNLWTTKLSPNTATVTMIVPDSIKNEILLNSIQLYVNPSRFIKKGSSRLPIRFFTKLPSVEILSITPRIITLTLEQKE